MQGDKAVKLKARLGVPDLQDLAPGVFAALDRPFVAVVVLHRRRRIATAVQFTDRVEERGATEPRLVAVEDNHTVQLERSEEHTSEIQSLMTISYAVFCFNKTKITKYLHT